MLSNLKQKILIMEEEIREYKIIYEEGILAVQEKCKHDKICKFMNNENKFYCKDCNMIFD